jgi:hypothetical protein
MKSYYKATSVEVLRPYVLRVSFADGSTQEIDVAAELYGEVFEPLKDPEFFARVELDAELGVVCWPNGADFSPEFLYQGGRVASEQSS